MRLQRGACAASHKQKGKSQYHKMHWRSKNSLMYFVSGHFTHLTESAFNMTEEEPFFGMHPNDEARAAFMDQRSRKSKRNVNNNLQNEKEMMLFDNW